VIMRSAAALAAVVIGAAGPASTIAPDVRGVLTRDCRLGLAELAELERGRIVRRGLDALASGEVGVVGAVRVAATADAFVESARRIEEFKRSPDVVQIGRFSDPPRLADLDRLTVEPTDVDLRRCRVGSCDIRLPAQAIARVQREIDWTAPDAVRRSAELFKRILFEHVHSYWLGGPGRITRYDDEKRAVMPAEDFDGLLKASPYVGALVPDLPAHLRDPVSHPLPAGEDVLYWSKEKFGLTPFITVTHQVITRAPSGTYVIASRDVYSSRYFDASLSFTMAGPAVDVPNAFYLVYVNRSRATALKGAFSSIRRAIVERRARNALEETLRTIKARTEQKP
jgi:hypothetical protein